VVAIRARRGHILARRRSENRESAAGRIRQRQEKARNNVAAAQFVPLAHWGVAVEDWSVRSQADPAGLGGQRDRVSRQEQDHEVSMEGRELQGSEQPNAERNSFQSQHHRQGRSAAPTHRRRTRNGLKFFDEC